ncbi:hypothetical protein Tco_0286056 [Tanacetum coccineum]
MNGGEVNPVHAYYNGSRSSKENEDESWSISFKTRRTQKTSSALEDFILLYLYLIGTLKKNVVEKDVQPNNHNVMALGMFKLDLEPLAPKEVLVYVKATCPSLTKHSEKLVAVTPLNKNKKVRFAETTTSYSNNKKQADSYKTQDSNKPVLPSTRMKSSTSASRS